MSSTNASLKHQIDWLKQDGAKRLCAELQLIEIVKELEERIKGLESRISCVETFVEMPYE